MDNNYDPFDPFYAEFRQLCEKQAKEIIAFVNSTPQSKAKQFLVPGILSIIRRILENEN